MSAPQRLLDDPETAEVLRTDLQAAATHQVSFDLGTGLARFEAALAQNATAAATSGLKTTLVKLGVAGVVGGAALGISLYATDSSEPEHPVVVSTPPPAARPSEPAAARPEPAEAAPVSEEAQAPTEPSATRPAPAPVAPQRPVTTPERSGQATVKPVPTSETRDDLLAREVRQLREIRQLAASNPGRALKLANEGHVQFKGGVLYQEREALALEALNSLGRRSELQQRGERYLQAFPNGSFSNRVRQLLGR